MESTQHNVLSTMLRVWRVPWKYQRETGYFKDHGHYEILREAILQLFEQLAQTE